MKLSKNTIVAIVIILLVVIGYFIFSANKNISVNKEALESEKKVGVTNPIIVPKDLIQCTKELIEKNCEEVFEETICGYDHSVYKNGEEKDHALQFRSACHYCKLYGLEEKEMGTTKINGLGYELKPCTQGMYKK
jgi:hypothetical protein